MDKYNTEACERWGDTPAYNEYTGKISPVGLHRLFSMK